MRGGGAKINKLGKQGMKGVLEEWKTDNRSCTSKLQTAWSHILVLAATHRNTKKTKNKKN